LDHPTASNEHRTVEGAPMTSGTQTNPAPQFGIITALPKEFAAVKVVLDNPYMATAGERGGRQYLIGDIPSAHGGAHTVAVAILPAMANNSAAARAALLLERFPSIQHILMVGIAGAAPNPDNPDEHVRLGDIVVSNAVGVVQYDYVAEKLADVMHRAPPRPPSAELLEAVALLEAAELTEERPWLESLLRFKSNNRFARPLADTDRLAKTPPETGWITHPHDPSRIPDAPRVFIGPIGSANKLLRNPVTRDNIARKFSVRAFEMEGSGIADAAWTQDAGYIVIRGTCDYCDANKNDVWHNYAAAVAAAYTRALLTSVPTLNSAAGANFPSNDLGTSQISKASFVLLAGASSLEYAHAELDSVRALLEKGKPVDAEVLVTRLRARTWFDLTPGQRWHLSTLDADAKLRLGKTKEAAKLLVEAVEYAPDSADATVNAVRGFMMNHQFLEARKLATEAKSRFPQSPAVVGEYIELVLKSSEVAEAVAALPEPIRNSVDVLLAFGSRIDFGDMAREAAKLCINKYPDEMRSWHTWGTWIASSEFRKISPLEPGKAHSLDRAQLKEALDCFSKMLELARALGHKSAEVEALLQRCSIEELLGLLDAAQDDINEALGIFPNDAVVLQHAGRIADARGEPGQATEFLRRAAKADGSADARFFLGFALSKRPGEPERREGIELLIEIAKSNNSYRAHALELAVEGLLVMRNTIKATELVADTEPQSDQVTNHALRARIAQHAKEAENARSHALAAVQAINKTTPRDSLRLLSKVLMNLEQYATALPMLLDLAVPGVEDGTGRRLVDCALRVERHDLVLDYCKKARAEGVYDDFLLERELALLERYDPEQAIVVLSDVLVRYPDHHHARVHLALIALRSQKLELVEALVPLLPSVDLVDAHEGAVVVNLLRATGRHEEATAFAYDLLRRFFKEHHAHRAFRDTILHRDSKDTPLTSESAAPGTAVELTANGKSEWHVLEDSPIEAIGVENELDLNLPFAKLLLGRRVGEEVVLSDGPGRRRALTITSIVPKVVYRLRDVWDRWQYRFPDQQEVWVQNIEEIDGKANFQPLLEMMAEGERRDAEVLEIYRNNTVPLFVFAKALQIEEPEALWRLAHLSNTPLSCCSSSEKALWFAYSSLDKCQELVLDLSALSTMAMLGCLEPLARARKKFIVSHECLYALRRLKSNLRFPFGFEHTLGKHWNGAKFFDFTIQQSDARDSFLDGIITFVESRCTVTGAPQVAQLSPEQRKELETTFGAVGLYTSVLARAPNRVLWTDDGVLAYVAEFRFRVRRVWTQVVLRWLLGQQHLELSEFDTLSTKLVGGGYQFTHMSQGIILACGNAAKWKPNAWPLNEAIASLANPHADILSLMRIAGAITSKTYLELVVPESRRSVLLAVLDALARRPGIRDSNFSDFRASIPGVFGLNSVAAMDAIETLDAWRAGRPMVT
jgi:nucleoside phosphorylase